MSSVAKKLRRIFLAGAVSVMALNGAALAQDVQIATPEQPLAQSLKDIARQSGENILGAPETVAGMSAHALSGTMTADEAVAALLAGTGLEAVPDGSGGLIIRRKSAERSGWLRERSGTVETVIVTAQKRDESDRDVPMSISVLGGEQLLRTGSTRFEDYIGKVPGLTLVSTNPGSNQIVARGISIGVSAFTSGVATYVDETPYTTEGPFANGGTAAPNLDTFDLQRIEVLRGPQGTLYGANALGGLMKYVTNAPDPSGFAGQVQAGVSTVEHGGTGYDLHGMVNVPLSDDAALRVVGYSNEYPGFIDDPHRGKKDINDVKISGVRASFLYAPSEDLSIRLSAIYQTLRFGDFSAEDVFPGTLLPVFGDLTQEREIPQHGGTDNEIYNATIRWNAGFADVLSTTSYMRVSPTYNYDFSAYYGGYLTGVKGSPYGAALDFKEPVHGITQEIRLSSHDSGPLEWLVGGYYTDETSDEYEGIVPVDLSNGQIQYHDITSVGAFYITSTYKEYAGFANLDYHITPTFDVAVGGRYSQNDQTYHQVNDGPLVGTADFITVSSEDVFTYSGDVRWHVAPNTMLYTRVASGFVPGGPNDVIPGSTLPPIYDSSSTLNYEVGVKSNLFDNRLSIDVDVFDVEWQNIQLIAQVGMLYGAVNGGTARSQGAEWAVGYVPLDGLTLNFSGAYTDARLTESTPASVGGHAGDRLPYSAFWTTAVSANYERPVFEEYLGFVNANWRFSGSRGGEFSTGTRQHLSSYNIFDLRAGIENERWTLALYVKNLSDQRAMTAVQTYSYLTATLNTPRTVGASLTANF